MIYSTGKAWTMNPMFSQDEVELTDTLLVR